MATIFEAREVLILASGANKAKAVAAGVEGEISDAVPPPPVIQRSAAYTLAESSWTVWAHCYRTAARTSSSQSYDRWENNDWPKPSQCPPAPSPSVKKTNSLGHSSAS